MNNKFALTIGLSFLFSNAYGASLPAKAVVTTRPAASFMQRVPMLGKELAYIGAASVVHSLAEKINPVITALFNKQNQEEESSYLAQSVSFTSNVLVEAAFNSWALPFFFRQQRESFRYYATTALVGGLLSIIVGKVLAFSSSKIEKLEDRKHTLLARGIAMPTATAGLCFARAKLTNQATYSMTKFNTRSDLFSFTEYLVGAYTFSTFIPLMRYIGDYFGALTVMLDFDESINAVRYTPTPENWAVAAERVNNIASIFNEKYSPTYLSKYTVMPAFFIKKYAEALQDARTHLTKLQTECERHRDVTQAQHLSATITELLGRNS